MPKKSFTEKHLSNWRIYEEIRQSQQFNMYSSEAREATGLDKKEYLFCMEHYSELKKAAEVTHAESN